MHPLKYLCIISVLFGVVHCTTHNRLVKYFRRNPDAIYEVQKISTSLTGCLSADEQLGLQMIMGNFVCGSYANSFCKSFYNSTIKQILALLARTSQPFIDCLARYSILHAEDRQAVIDSSAKFICDLGGANLYCKPGVVPLELKATGPTWSEMTVAAPLRDLIKAECYYKCLSKTAKIAEEL